MYALREDLVVENKIVGIFQQGKVQQNLGTEGAVTRVVFGKLDAQKQILKRSQEPVRDVFIERHSAAKRLASDNSRAKHHVVDVMGHHAGHSGDQQRSVLVIRMQHDYYVRARGQSFAITSLLVAAV